MTKDLFTVILRSATRGQIYDTVCHKTETLVYSVCYKSCVSGTLRVSSVRYILFLKNLLLFDTRRTAEFFSYTRVLLRTEWLNAWPNAS